MYDPVKEVLIIGMGNDILMDSGIGPGIVKDLQNEIEGDLCDFLFFEIGSPEMVFQMAGYRQVFIIDAKKSENGKPGEVHCCSLKDYSTSFYLDNIHDFSLSDSLSLAGEMNVNLPEEVYIITVEIQENMVFSMEFSPVMEECYPDIFDKVMGIIESRISQTAS